MSTPPSKFTYPISNIRVIDGDTIEADVDLGFRIKQRQVIRLAGIDAPELRARYVPERVRAIVSKDFFSAAIEKAEEVVMHSTGLDKYGRSLAVLWCRIGEQWTDANSDLVHNGYAARIK